MLKKPIFFVVLLCCLLAACQQPRSTADLPAPNFYYWKTSLHFDKMDKAMADSLGVKKLYLRYFDVDWSPTRGMAVPVGELAELRYDGQLHDTHITMIEDMQVVPTVFLTNRVFTEDVPVDVLAKDVSRKIKYISSDVKSRVRPWNMDFEHAEETSNWEKRDSIDGLVRTRFEQRMTEIQLDCDWTPSTKERYFAFLKEMKTLNPDMAISCTVRLHQFRDQQSAGIPPVDRGTLMCYNVAPPKDPAVADAIFDPALVNGYLKNGDYPLPLEAALPLFSWGALFHEDQFRGLASGLSLSEVENNPLFEPMGNDRFRFTQDTVFSEKYMRRGDVVRLDGASPTELMALAERLAEVEAVYGVSFFEWGLEGMGTYRVGEVFRKFGEGKNE